MTNFQIIAIAILVGTVAWNYLPSLPAMRIPTLRKKPDSLQQIAQVIAIKESSANPKVVDACQQLLQALIS